MTAFGVQAAADEAVQAAKDAGAAGGYGSAAARAVRDTAVLARLSCGTPQAEVAAELGISPRTVRRIKRTRGPLDERPVELLEGLLRTYRQVIADFEPDRVRRRL